MTRMEGDSNQGSMTGITDDTGETGDNETKTGDNGTTKTGDHKTMRTMTAPKDKGEGQAPQQNHGRDTTEQCRCTQDDPLRKTTNDGEAVSPPPPLHCV